MKKQVSLLLLATILTANVSFAAGNYSYKQSTQAPPTYNTNKPLRGSVIVVPSGAVVDGVTTVELNSENLVVGQGVSMAIGSDYFYNNHMIAPAGSILNGTVTEAKSSKRAGLNARLQVRFTEIITPYGVRIPISGLIKTDDGTGVLVGGTKMDTTKTYAKDMVVGSAAGALSGLVFGALAGGSVGKGAALGTAVGAGGGLVKSLWSKGGEIVIPQNAHVDVILTQPITINPAQYSYEE